MSSKADLQCELNEIGYELGPFTSKDTLSNIIRLHSLVMTDKDINVSKLSDINLRKLLTQHGLLVGPVTSHTRAIYQRKLLEILTNETSEGQDDEFEIDESILQTQYDINEENTLYPNIFNTKPLSSTKTNSYSSRNNNPYNFENDQSMIIRHDYKATTSSRDTLLTNIKPSIQNSYRDQNLYDDSNGIRPRILTKSNEQQSIKINNDSTPKKVNNNDKLQVATKSGGTFLYAGITIIVALIVFIVYLWLEK